MTDTPSGRYFEEFPVGETLLSGRRTVTETDVTAFAGLSGDFNPLHTDEVFAQSTPSICGARSWWPRPRSPTCGPRAAGASSTQPRSQRSATWARRTTPLPKLA